MKDFLRYLYRKQKKWLLSLALIGISLAGIAQQSPPTKQRWIAYGIMNVENGDSYLPLIRQAASDGCNAVFLNINWDKVYRKRGDKPNWDQFDKQLALARELNIKIVLRIWVGRHEPFIGNEEGWWPKEIKTKSADNLIPGAVQNFSYWHDPSLNEAGNFVKEVLERYNSYQREGRMLFVTVVNNKTAETHYDLSGQGKGGNAITTFDYSDPTLAAWPVWLREKYTTIENLNTAWKTNLRRFEDAHPPRVPGDPFWENFAFQSGQDWYLFRHDGIRRFIDKMVKVTKGVNSGYQFVPDYGSVFDGLTLIRGTYAFKTLGAGTDGVKNNNSPAQPHRFIADLIRSNVKPGQWIGSEVDASVSWASEADYKRQVNEWFEHGGNFINMFGFDRDFSYPKIRQTIREMSKKWLNGTIPDINPKETVSYTLSEAIKQGTDPVQKRWKILCEKSKEPVRVELKEDLIVPVVVPNKNPKLNRTIPNQKGKVGERFSFRVEDNYFSDEDGVIVQIDLEGAPRGLVTENGTLEGTPLEAGKFTIRVKAVDNDGGSISTSFELEVAPPDQHSAVFHLYKAGNANTRQLVRPIEEGDTLSGEVMSGLVNIFAEPRNGIAVGSFSLVISGPFSVNTIDSRAPYGFLGDNGGRIFGPGVYTLRAVGFTGSHLSGTVMLQQTVRFVVAQQPPKVNQPPVLSVSPPTLYATVGNEFSHQFANTTFTDPDGQIVSTRITGLPEGLSSQGLRITGTPLKEGTYTPRILATDNDGATSAATFSIVVAPKKANQPPVVATPIAAQTAAIGVPFTFQIPAGTFTDSDGTISRVVIGALPAGLISNGDKFSGTPEKEGTHTITITAFDNTGASVQTTFQLTIIRKNAPPTTLPVPDVLGIVGQVFSYEVASFFSDPDGDLLAISYTSALPPGLTASGSSIVGNPTAAGVYPVGVRATDGKGGEVSASFTIRVERPELRLEFVTAGNAQVRRSLRNISNGDVVPIQTLGNLVNIMASSNANINLIQFAMTGPVKRQFLDEAFPYGLFGDEGGFTPQIGTYNLVVQGYLNNTLVVSRTIRFDLIQSGSTTLREGVLEEEVAEEALLTPWIAFPNPFQTYVKVPLGSSSRLQGIDLINMTGQSQPIAPSDWKVERQLLEVNMTPYSSQATTYILRIVEENGRQHAVKLLKADY